MYKTVRHGENSLQYTILPQTEEVISNSGMKGKGRDYSPSIHVRRSRRKSTIKYILLVIIGIIIALALTAVPLYVMNGTLYTRRHHRDNHEIITTPPLTPTGHEIVKSRKKELKVAPIIVLTAEPKTEASTTSRQTISTGTSMTTTTTTATPVTTDRATTPPWTMPALRSWKNSPSSITIPPIPTEDSDEIPLVGTPSGSIRLLDHYKSRKPWEDIIIKPTVTAEPMTVRNILRYFSKSYAPSEKPVAINEKALEDVLITTKVTPTHGTFTTDVQTTERSKFKDLKETLLSVDDDDEFKESLEVDEVFSLPPLKPETAVAGPDDEVTVSKAGDNGWYGARWPFVDTSSYFQWTDYSPGDNLLLPLLMATLTSVVLVLLLVIAIRRLKRSRTSSAALGQLAAEQQEDNTNLLTAENPEDGEE